jgi:carbamate kinase
MAGHSHGAGTDRIVVALGGNTLLGEHGARTFDDQRDAIARTAREIATVVRAGHDVVLTHGNGPQVGDLLLQQERVGETPQVPLDVLVAETQAQIGYLLQQALDNELADSPECITVVTQVLVDADDPAFQEPTKPIGPSYTEAEAAETSFETRRVSTGDRPYRRVVPSPEPVEVVEGGEISRLVERGSLVITAGGGGVPVVRDDGLRGVEAVVDKDRTARLLASDLGTDTLVFLTDVEFAYVNYDTPDQRPLRRASPEEVRAHLDADEFGRGSMHPKMEAAVRFVERGGERAVVTPPEQLVDALAGETGTQILA